MSEVKRCTGNDCLVDTCGMRDGKPLCNECWEKTITETQKPEAVLSNSTVLLCCPFCGGKGVGNTLTHTESGQTFDGVKCMACQAMTLTKQIWQNRAT